MTYFFKVKKMTAYKISNRMIQKISCLIVGLLVTVSLLAQTPEQSYFEWTDLPFSKEELIQRRTKFVKLLKKQGKSGLVLIPARDMYSHGETFRQLDDFYYFTGLELPNAILALDLAMDSIVLYVPERDLRFENGSRRNDFPGRPFLYDQEIADKTDLRLKNIATLSTLLDLKANTNTSILINCGRQGPISFLSEEYISSPAPFQILIHALQSKHNGLKYENIYGSVALIRMIKSPSEIELLRKAVTITEKGIITACKSIKPGIDERFLEGVMEGDFKMNGAQRLAFGSIIKSGPNSLWPWRILATHYNRRNRVMTNGDLVIFDVGCEYNQYVSDVGRTFPVSGKFSERQLEILQMEMDISNQIIEFIKPGITFHDIRQLTDRIIPEDAKTYMQVGLFFGHHLGLSTGDPNLSSLTLQPGMVFTVEPWYYNHDEQISVFTEDVILITKDGNEILSKTLPRTPEGLERLMKE